MVGVGDLDMTLATVGITKANMKIEWGEEKSPSRPVKNAVLTPSRGRILTVLSTISGLFLMTSFCCAPYCNIKNSMKVELHEPLRWSLKVG